MTCVMPSMSMPRAAMSVATSTRSLPALEVVERALARVLRLVAVDRLGARCRAASELLGDAVGAVLGAGEDQRARRCSASLQDLAQQRALVALLDEVDPLVDPLGGASPPASPSTATGSRRIVSASLAISRGMVAENSSVCRCAGSVAMMRRTSWMKPMSSMRSASSSTKTSSRSSWTVPWPIRSSSRPGRGDQRCRRRGACACDLRMLADAAEDDGVAQAEVAAVGREAVARSGRPARASASAPARAAPCGAGLRRGSRTGAAGSAARTPRSCRCRSGRSRAGRGRSSRCGIACAWIGVGVV